MHLQIEKLIMTVHFRMYSRFILAIDQHASVARRAKCFTYISLTRIFFQGQKNNKTFTL